MREIVNISEDAKQRHLISLEESEITLILKFFPTVQQWFFDVEYKLKWTYNVKLSLGVLHIQSRNYPFDFIVTDKSGSGIDPFRINDFNSGRCKFYILDPAEMEIIRGIAVEI